MLTYFKSRTSPEYMAINALKLIRKSHRILCKDISELDAETPKLRRKNMRSVFEKTKNLFQSTQTRITGALANLTKRKTRNKTAYRQMKVEHGLTRDAFQPNLLKAVIVIQGCILGEGLLTAALMIADGKLDVLGGISYGMTVSALNVCAGLFAGFFCLRYMFFKINAPVQGLREFLIRLLARTGFMFFIAVMGLLGFAAARVRATGSHANIFDFSEISFFSTFTDYYGIAIIVTGILGGMLAIFEGYQGLSDPVPQFSKARKDAEERIDHIADDMHENALDTLARLLGESCDTIEENNHIAEDEQADFKGKAIALNAKIATHNHHIDNALDRLRVMHAHHAKQNQYIRQQAVMPDAFDESAFEQLRIAEIPFEPDVHIPDAIQESTPLIADLEALYEEAVSAINESYDAFLNNHDEFDLNLEGA